MTEGFRGQLLPLFRAGTPSGGQVRIDGEGLKIYDNGQNLIGELLFDPAAGGIGLNFQVDRLLQIGQLGSNAVVIIENGSAAMPRGRIAYKELTAASNAFTALADVTNGTDGDLSITFTLPYATHVMLVADCLVRSSIANDIIEFEITDNSNGLVVSTTTF